MNCCRNFVFNSEFFRDPGKKNPFSKNIVVAPADGKIIVIKQNIFNHFVGENCSQISIFMSPLNVHVNRIPIDGKVEHLKYYEGKFVAAFEDKASENNERMETGIVNSEGKILFTQVAGFLARRIVNELKIGDEVKTGERFGMIKFGSRVDIFVPSKYIPAVNLNENVYAGETILFEIKTK
ncbi:MAG: phosphatidylserine decarboxylase [Ignavibacteriaceae bacterium]|nr:phosphatidylserine decarboxylase [Ignavibacteriaceae bacterium]